jgi:dimethylaniline monooxygenase (N-oxide forming)
MMKGMIVKRWGERLRPEWNLRPEDAASIAFQAPMVTDTMVPLLEAGKIRFVPEITRILEGGQVEFKDRQTLHVDAIVFCTGYNIDPTLSKIVQRDGDLQLPRLYKNIYHPDYPNSLAFLTFWYTASGIYEVGELASMGIAQVFSGRYQLPTRARLNKDIDASHAFVNDLATRVPHPITLQSAARCLDRGPWLTFLHEIAGTQVMTNLGFGWIGWWFWWSDREFCRLLMTGVNSIHTARLFDGRPGSRKKWDGARRAIIQANQDVACIEEKLREQDSSRDKVDGNIEVMGGVK